MSYTWTRFNRRSVISTLVIVVALLILPFTSERFQDLFYVFIYWVERLMELQPIFGAVFFFLLSGLSALLAFASNIALIPSAILTYGAPLALFLLWGGWIAGATVAYIVGSRLARPALTAWVPSQKLSYYQNFISREANFFTVLLFCLAVPSEIPGYIFGVLKYPFRRFILAMALSEILYAIAVILAVENILRQDYLVTGGILSSVLILTSLTSFLFFRHQRKY